MKVFKLAADTINGVYEVDSIPPAPTVIMSDFIDELKEDFEGTKYGIVSEDEAQKIDAEYGIKWLA